MAESWAETSRSGTVRETAHEYVKEIIGVMLLAADTGYPTMGQTDAGGVPSDAITDYIVQSIAIDTTSHTGRVFTRQQAVKLRAAP